MILGIRTFMGEDDFKAWGWRIPFLISVVLLGISVWIRMQLNESPTFKRMKEEGKGSKAPIAESFGQWKNLKVVLLALLGLTAGQAVVWYTGQFYALFFLTQTLKVDANTANIMIALALLIGTRSSSCSRAVGQDRPQAHHHGRLPDRRADLLPDLPGSDPLRQPGAGKGPGLGPDGDRGSGDLLVPVQPVARPRSPAPATWSSPSWPATR